MFYRHRWSAAERDPGEEGRAPGRWSNPIRHPKTGYGPGRRRVCVRRPRAKCARHPRSPAARSRALRPRHECCRPRKSSPAQRAPPTPRQPVPGRRGTAPPPGSLSRPTGYRLRCSGTAAPWACRNSPARVARSWRAAAPGPRPQPRPAPSAELFRVKTACLPEL